MEKIIKFPQKQEDKDARKAAKQILKAFEEIINNDK